MPRISKRSIDAWHSQRPDAMSLEEQQHIPHISSVVAAHVAEMSPAVPPDPVMIPEELPASRDLLQITARKLGIPTYRDGQVHYRKSITCTLKSYQKFMEESYADVYAKLEELPEYDSEDNECVMQYSVRRFEIDCMTMEYLVCQCCSFSSVTPGIFSQDREAVFPVQKRKKIYRNSATGLYRKLVQKDVLPMDQWIEIVCTHCIKDITDGFQPRFSPIGGFNHGFARPPELE
jgi:hypothetical protein